MKKRNTRRSAYKLRNTAILRGYVTPDVDEEFRRACTAVGTSCSDAIREFAISTIRKNHNLPYVIKDKAKLTDFSPKFFPGRCASYGAIPRMRITV